MAEPHSLRHAIAAQLFDESEHLFSRVEKLPPLIEAANQQLAKTAQALDEGADRYRLALTAFNAEARDELSELVQRKSKEASIVIVEDHRATLHEIARAAFRSEASDKAAALANSLERASAELRLFRKSHLIETMIVSVASSAVTAALLWYAMR